MLFALVVAVYIFFLNTLLSSSFGSGLKQTIKKHDYYDDDDEHRINKYIYDQSILSIVHRNRTK